MATALRNIIEDNTMHARRITWMARRNALSGSNIYDIPSSWVEPATAYIYDLFEEHVRINDTEIKLLRKDLARNIDGVSYGWGNRRLLFPEHIGYIDLNEWTLSAVASGQMHRVVVSGSKGTASTNLGAWRTDVWRLIGYLQAQEILMMMGKDMRFAQMKRILAILESKKVGSRCALRKLPTHLLRDLASY